MPCIYEGFTAVQGKALYVSSVVRKIERQTDPEGILPDAWRVFVTKYELEMCRVLCGVQGKTELQGNGRLQ